MVSFPSPSSPHPKVSALGFPSGQIGGNKRSSGKKQRLNSWRSSEPTQSLQSARERSESQPCTDPMEALLASHPSPPDALGLGRGQGLAQSHRPVAGLRPNLRSGLSPLPRCMKQGPSEPCTPPPSEYTQPPSCRGHLGFWRARRGVRARASPGITGEGARG